MGGTCIMETNSGAQQTLFEFFSPTKAQRVWRLILAILLTAMILGAAYELSRPKAEPVALSHETSEGTYSYLDLQLLSDWVYDAGDSDSYRFYEAMDADGNWFLVNLDQKTFESLSPYVDAYEAYFADGSQNSAYPEPTRLTGMPSYITYDVVTTLADFYEMSVGDFESLFGSYSFNEGASNAMENAMLYIVFGVILGLFFLAVVLQIASVQKHRKTSEDRLYALGLQDEAELQLSDPETLRFDKLRLALSRDFAYVGTSGYVLPYTDIGWLYKRTQRNHGITIATQLMAGTVYGKTILLAPRLATDEFITTVAQKVLAKNPNCMIGYSFDLSKTYYQRVREYKASNPK